MESCKRTNQGRVVKMEYGSTKRGPLINIIRWIAVLPTAVVSPVIVCTLVLAMCFIGDVISGEFWMYLRHPEIISIDHFLISFVIWGIFGYFFVISGSKMAPTYRKAIAFILFGIATIAFGFIGLFSAIALKFSDSWRLIVCSILCIITAGVAAFTTEDANQCTA